VTPHVAVPPHLALPPEFAHVMDYLALFDAELRLRRSAERPNLFVLERRLRRQPWANTGLRDESDMLIQARDGYVHVATVHPNWLNRPWKMVEALKTEGVDLWETKGAATVADELEYEEAWKTLTRKRRRRQLFREIALDAFDVLDRMGNPDGTDRVRVSVPTRSHTQILDGR
jgi:hypothetical protein